MTPSPAQSGEGEPPAPDVLALEYRTAEGAPGEMLVEKARLRPSGRGLLSRVALGLLHVQGAPPIPVGTGLDPLREDGPWGSVASRIGEAPLLSGPVTPHRLLAAWDRWITRAHRLAPDAFAEWCASRAGDPDAAGPLLEGAWRQDIPWGLGDREVLSVDAREDPETARRALGAIQLLAWIHVHAGPTEDVLWQERGDAPEGIDGLERWARRGQRLAARRAWGDETLAHAPA